MTTSGRESDSPEDGVLDRGSVHPLLTGHVRVLSSVPASTSDDHRVEGMTFDSVVVQLVSEPHDGRIVIDGLGRIRRANTALEKLFGYQQGELLGQPVEVLIPEPARAAHVAARARFGATPKMRPMGLRMQLVGRHRDGREIAVDVRLTPLLTKAGNWVVADVREDTQRRSTDSDSQVAVINDGDLRIAHGVELTEIVEALDDVIDEIRAVIGEVQRDVVVPRFRQKFDQPRNDQQYGEQDCESSGGVTDDGTHADGDDPDQHHVHDTTKDSSQYSGTGRRPDSRRHHNHSVYRSQ